MIKELLSGIGHFFTASNFLARHKLLHYYLYPVLAVILFYTLILGFLARFSGWLIEKTLGPYLPDRLPAFDGFWSFLSRLGEYSLHGIFAFVAGLLLFMLIARFSKYIILILLSPVFAFLSEKVDECVSGKKYPFDLFQLIRDILRGILVALRNLALELFLMALFSALSLFSAPLALAAGPLLWLIGAYYYGFSMLDYTCERRRMSIREGVLMIRRRRWLALGNGMMYALISSLPVIGLILAPVNAVTGATTALLQLEKDEKTETAAGVY